ncbi:sensor histidine kinase [Streptantibioticus silvisoli]|uniref:histidine kinase n=1 Tax=Streptantibioticus silvisoli TaxID=2705255 RepID=A0ABT6VT72_9ACTN|nr:histidine kinase [Streptantibioticus silvisoli]MDI5961676.1 histidine kinase [Streptantibioticus silvisoli]
MTSPFTAPTSPFTALGRSLTALARPRKVLVALACVLAGALVVLEALNAPYPPVVVAAVLTGGLCVAALVVPRHHLVRLAVAAASASAVLSVVEARLPLRPQNTPGMVELCALLLAVARSVRRLPPPAAVLTAAAPALAAVLIPLRIQDRAEDLGPMVGLVVVFAVPFAVVLGLCLRLYDTVRERRAEAIRQDQRLEHARQLHDFVAHHITAVVVRTKAARFAAAGGHAQSPAQLDDMLDAIERAGSEAMTSMRAMVTVLRDTAAPAATRPLGTIDALRDLTDRFTAAGPPAALVLDPRLADRRLPPETAATARDVVRESLTNVHRHAAGATRVEVRVHLLTGASETLEVSVTDDGRAAPAARQLPVGGTFGLVGLTERVERAGGHVTAGAAEDGGWRVRAVLPLAEGPGGVR